jgi:50S ribosomal protein L16 3-hydroxylase
MKLQLLGNLTPRAFLQRHWQKRPLFVRRAIPGFRGMGGGLRDLQTLFALAARDDVESRMVQRRGRRWNTVHGPFRKRMALRKRDATLLVSGVNLHLRAADRLLRRFDFIPQARLDDVMVSWATPGGGVGPHVDSYDVFLLQGLGRRRWRTWFPNGAFHREFVADQGDLLYLPPGWKHDGVALEACTTYSIGFRAPRGVELCAAFLDWLHERGLPDARYGDAGLKPATDGAAIPRGMLLFSEKILKKISWRRKDVALFLGEYLSAPKPHVVFRPVRRHGSLSRSTLHLDPKTQLLHSSGRFFINGESFAPARRAAATLRELADRRSIRGERLAGGPLAGLISEWLRAGYAHLERPQRQVGPNDGP